MSIAWNTVARTADGQAVLAATLDNGRGLRARVMNYGVAPLELRYRFRADDGTRA